MRSGSMGVSQMSAAPTGNKVYSVKYLGIVDGAMGILSRKMAMQGNIKDNAGAAADTVKVN